MLKVKMLKKFWLLWCLNSIMRFNDTKLGVIKASKDSSNKNIQKPSNSQVICTNTS